MQIENLIALAVGCTSLIGFTLMRGFEWGKLKNNVDRHDKAIDTCFEDIQTIRNSIGKIESSIATLNAEVKPFTELLRSILTSQLGKLKDG